MSRDLSPKELVAELDKFIVGQDAAKRAVAIAVRNRWRRKRLPPELRDEVSPKNIIMIGPTGVGKTEIARRLARLVRSPFVKVEASKFTEVGYVGRDVEGMVRDLVDAAVNMVKDEMRAAAEDEARAAADEALLDLLVPGEGGEESKRQRTRERFRRLLAEGHLDEREVEVSYETAGGGFPAGVGFLPAGGPGPGGLDLGGLLRSLGPRKKVTRKLPVAEARRVLTRQEADKRIDEDKARAEAVARAESDGIIFLDEVDKVAVSREQAGRTGDVSRQGVQRDLLPIVEGTSVQTRHGWVRTDHILFIAAGAFHMAKPSDLIPELQGRFPIRVELTSLGSEEFRRILTEPEASLTRQYTALLATEGVELVWHPEGIRTLAELAVEVNARTADIGARRLHTLLEKLLEELLFAAPESRGARVTIDAATVQARLSELVHDEDLSRYIL
ncbi:MAG: ATP-dependent protease ATPase subunit HslU [Planctomycetota bacterium]|nr:MAG: ATP-dependent protease ATPase subunit HslU [Planctomycetota bacterium]